MPAEPDPVLEPPFVLLEDRETPGASARLYTKPEALICCRTAAAVQGAFAQIEADLARGLHAAGWFAYELGQVLEPRLDRGSAGAEAPLLCIGLFPPPRLLPGEELDAVFAALGPPRPIRDLEVGHDRATHVAKVERLLDLIGAGDLYQANLTFPIRFGYDADPRQIYAALRVRQPTAHSALVALDGALDGTWILSASPELFLQVRGGQATCRPMKGTRARDPDPGRDAEAARALLADPKERSENLMIVDLMRNDLARIARPGAVRVPALFTVESYPTLHTLTSTVTADLRPGVGLAELMTAMFPCGSIVGAPKIRAAEVLADLEPGPRGVYTGAVGAFSPGGDIDLNVAIRTAVLGPDGVGVYGVGGGIVADSNPDAEYDEALLKARSLWDLAEDFGLIETFRWSASEGFIRLGAHLDRLSASAATLGFRFDRPAAAARISEAAQAWRANLEGDQRVRLEFGRDGRVAITSAPAPPADDRAPKVGVASVRLDAGDPALRHKTTRRAAYDAAVAETEAAGLDEALLLNRSGDLADGARHSVFVAVEGSLITPPLASGALPGVLRAALLREGRAVEGRVTRAMLAKADGLFIGNSLRGLRRATLVD